MELIQHCKSLLTENVNSQVPEVKCKGLKLALSPPALEKGIRIQDDVLQDDTPETSLPVLASRLVRLWLTFHPKPAESP